MSRAPRDIAAFFDCVAREGLTLVSAHRAGPAPGFAENAIETMRNTLALTPHAALEIDVQRTADGALVLMHDDTVNRTTNGRGAVREMTLDQLRALRLRDNDGLVLDAHPPTLREALDAGRDAILQLDVKRGTPFEQVIAEVRAAGAQNRAVIITYNDDDALLVQRLAPELMQSASIFDVDDFDRLRGKGFDVSRALAFTGVREPNAALNAALQQAGVESIFGTLGRPGESWDSRFARSGEDQYAAFAETGLEMIATDRPSAAARALGAAADPTMCLTAE
jgi:glycerophosphoryl diester phosphodiesterase